ncbi:hypothetical protein NQ314_001517 [Rhamnusium bicolor]|uniref:SF4 helicase domain-containing protein n=1 Tax=Rhamnusium bicolor TaxID=1586634 RepID=A0AAV8ZV66_9CUCU|nr:hypothetical protein NQ314_001517 [Rhamnusium bicolor]
MYFPLENVENEVVGYRKIHSRSNEDVVLPSVMYGGILTGRLPKSKDTAVLVPNISDFLVLLNSKVSANVVCLPNSVNNLSQYVLPSLERFKKLILWFGNDTKSWDASRHFAKKIRRKTVSSCKCLQGGLILVTLTIRLGGVYLYDYVFRPNEKQQLPHLDDSQDFKAVINNAQPMWHKSITTFASLRAEVLSDLQNIDKVQGVKWKRYPTLNKILKGHRRGELTVFTGPTGSGKTTFISDYSLDLAMQGVNTLWGSFEIRNARLARTMLQQMAGVTLDDNLHVFDYWADQFEKLPVYFMTFHGQQAIKVVMEVAKNRYSGDLGIMTLDFDKSSLSYQQKKIKEKKPEEVAEATSPS